MKKIVIIGLHILFNCQSLLPVKEPIVNYGTESGNVYQSYKGKFVCYIPVDWRYAIVNEGKYGVSFFDNNIGLYKIQAIKIKPDFIEQLNLLGKEKTLKAFIEKKLINRLGVTRAGTKILFEEFNIHFKNGVYFFILNVPEVVNPEIEAGTNAKQYAIMTFVSGSFIYIFTRDANVKTISSEEIQSARENILDFSGRTQIIASQITDSKLGFDIALNDIDESEPEEDDESEEEEEEGGGGGGASAGGEIDLGGIIQVLQKRLRVPKGKFDIKPGRFKSNIGINKNRFKTSDKMHVKPARFKNSFRPSRWRR